MKRYLETSIRDDLKKKMVLVAGPRQVGKTTRFFQGSALWRAAHSRG
jgi:predicted AAA+ superfamily ATPase